MMPAAAEAPAIDPVCGMSVDPVTALHSRFQGHDVYFCSASCKQRFDAAPAAFPLDGVSSHAAMMPAATPAPRGGEKVEYVCPMDPEIVRDAPGACPICGMALEPRVATLDAGPNPELLDMKRRFFFSAALSIPLLIIGMSDLFGGRMHELAMKPWLPWLELMMAAPVVLWGGWPFFQRGWISVVTRHLNMFTLIALGTGAAFGYSLIATFFPQLFPSSFRSMGVLPLYYEPAAMITTLVLLGQVLELRARDKTSSAIRALLGLAPKTARVVDEQGNERDLPVEEIIAGMRVRVRPASAFRSTGPCWKGTEQSMNR
jgi:Cation transport ATPase